VLRCRVVPILVAIVEADSPLRVVRREDLADDAEVSIALGDAPDGLPLILRVERRASIDGAVRAALGWPERLEPDVDAALGALESAVAAAARRAGIIDVRGTRLYRTHATVAQLLGESMLARLLGGHSPLVLADDRVAAPGRAERAPNTAVLAVASSPVTLMKVGVSAQRHVAIPLRSGPAFLAEPGLEIEPESLEPLRFEDLRRTPTARFQARGGRELDGLLADEDAYRRAVRDNPSLGWSVGAADVARMIAEVARSLAVLHDDGRVHGDVKPANAVVTANGAVAIDPLGVTIGQLSPGATPGWAAPEQILARPVSPATDVYALGLMVASLLGAAIYGEERSFVVPVGRSDRRRVRLLADHDVWIDPETNHGMSSGLRDEWQDFIRQCVEFDPDDRPDSALTFAERLDELAAGGGLERALPLPAGPGTLRKDTDVLGVTQPAWIVRDAR
jgi:hypothetical protein